MGWGVVSPKPEARSTACLTERFSPSYGVGCKFEVLQCAREKQPYPRWVVE